MGERYVRVGIHFQAGFFTVAGTAEGIASAAAAAKRVELVQLPAPSTARFSDIKREFKIDGLLLNIVDHATADRVLRSGLPTVTLLAGYDHPKIARVCHDMVEVGRVGGEHLLSRGYLFPGFFANLETTTNREQADWFERGLNEAYRSTGRTASRFNDGPRIRRSGWSLKRQVADLAEWLSRQPLPLGLMCSDDMHATRATMACAAAGLRVPQDVGVIGVFDQTEYSTLNAPTITSVPLNLRAHGRAAMETLLKIIRDGDPFTGTRMVTPLLPVVRQSTAHCRCDDPLVNQASQFIHDHAGKLLNVDDVADHFEVNRRTLERRFRQAVGTSPYQRIQDARIELTRRLIIESDRPLAEIALDTGFRYVSNLSQSIKKHTGHSPTELRQQYR